MNRHCFHILGPFETPHAQHSTTNATTRSVLKKISSSSDAARSLISNSNALLQRKSLLCSLPNKGQKPNGYLGR